MESRATLSTLLLSLTMRHRARLREIVSFVVVGISNTAVDFIVLNLLITLTHYDNGWRLLIFNGLSFLAAVVNSYILNGRITFRNTGTGNAWRFFRFIVVNALGLLINSITVWLMAPLLSPMFPVITAINVSKALATLLSLCWNYLAFKRWIFRTEIPMTHRRDEVHVRPLAGKPGELYEVHARPLVGLTGSKRE